MNSGGALELLSPLPGRSCRGPRSRPREASPGEAAQAPSPAIALIRLHSGGAPVVSGAAPKGLARPVPAPSQTSVPGFASLASGQGQPGAADPARPLRGRQKAAAREPGERRGQRRRGARPVSSAQSRAGSGGRRLQEEDAQAAACAAKGPAAAPRAGRAAEPAPGCPPLPRSRPEPQPQRAGGQRTTAPRIPGQSG